MKGKNDFFFQKGQGVQGFAATVGEIKIKNNKTIIVVKGPLPPNREGRGATF